MIPWLDDDTVRAALHWNTLIPAMRHALGAYSAGRVIQPVREWLTLEEGQRYWGVMPAASDEVMGLKAVSLYPRNAGTGVPTISALVLLVDPNTGAPLAVMDGRMLTAMRTAAVSAAVTDTLASPESRVLALLGSGLEAETHLEALRAVRPLEEVRVWSRTPANARRFAERFGATAMDAEAAVRGADIIVTATPAQEPILRGAWLKPGAHVNAIGAPMPTWRELDDEAMAHLLVVDSREAAHAESGDVILSGAPIYAEAGELFNGTAPRPETQTTIFKSVGLAIEDVATAKLVYEATHDGR